MNWWRRLAYLEERVKQLEQFKNEWVRCCVCGKLTNRPEWVTTYYSSSSYAYCEAHKPAYDYVDIHGNKWRNKPASKIKVDDLGKEII